MVLHRVCGLVRVRLGVLMLLLGTATAQGATTCDAGDVCLDPQETRSFEAARAALNEGRIGEAITLLEALRAEREQAELEPSLLIINDLAVAMARAGRTVEAALMLEDWLRGRPELDVSFSNLGLLYEALANRDPQGDLAPGLEVASVTLREAPAAALPAPPADALPRTPTRVAAPITTPSSTAAEGADDTAVRQQLDRWREAWERGDIEGYLELYSSAGSPRAGMARNEWRAQRRQRVHPDRQIELRVSALDVQQLSRDLLVTEFDQGYRARNYADEERKRIEWVREAGSWRIRREISLP